MKLNALFNSKEVFLWNPIESKVLFSQENLVFPEKAAFTEDDLDSNKSSIVWLNSKEAAGYLKVSVAQLFNLTSTGNLPYYKLGRSNRYKQNELDEFLEKERRGLNDD